MNQKQALFAGALAALGASVCCVGPLVLLSIGIGGTWIGSLTVVEPYRPFFIALTLLFLGLAFRKLYLIPRTCEPGKLCADEETIKRQRFIFWLITVPLLGLVAFPWVAPLFY